MSLGEAIGEENKNEMDLGCVVNSRESVVFGKKVLYVPRCDKKDEVRKIIVVMSAHNQAGKYMALRAFVENQETDLLFVTDPNNTWYLDDDVGKTYSKVFDFFLRSYRPENVYFFGSSMSGYAAIHFALKFNANAISVNPQVNLDISKDYAWPELKLHIEEIPGDYLNLDEWCVSNWKNSVVYVMHGHDDIDVINVDLLLNSAPSQRKIIVQTLGLDSHAMFFGKNVSQIYSVLSLVEQYRKLADHDILSANLTDEIKRKAVRRERRNELQLPDPYRRVSVLDGVTWQRRYLYEKPGSVVFFENVGFYLSDGRLSGAICQFDGARWRLVSPRPTSSDNIIGNHSFVEGHNGVGLENNQILTGSDGWWLRNDKSAHIKFSCEDGLAKVSVANVNSKNVYIGLSIDLKKMPIDFFRSLQGRYLTLSAQLSSDCGFSHLTLGGYSESGYHHRNSNQISGLGFSDALVFEYYHDIVNNHKEPVFVRVNLCPDGKDKVVRIKNLSLVNGYFPMGLE